VDPRAAVAADYPALYPARFWILTVVIAALTAVAGLWASDDFGLDNLKNIFSEPHFRTTRLAVHIVLGICLVVLPLVLALFANLSRGWLLTSMIFSLLLVLVAGAQVWMGVLLTFDSNDGPLTKFKPDQTIVAPTTKPSAVTMR
jgi:hypothetical protein